MSPAALCVALFVAPAQANPEQQAPPKPKVAVVGIKVEADQPIALTAVDVLVTEIAAEGRFDVISKHEIDSMLGLEKLKELAGCDEVTCMAEIGGALGVERLISGSIGKLGAGFVVSLQLINVAYGNVENRVSMQWLGPEQTLADVLRAAAQQLVLPLKEKKPGSVDVTQTPPDAQVYIDNKPAGLHADKLDIGPHTFKVTADGYNDRVDYFVMKSGEALTLDGSLQKREQPPIEIRPVGLVAELEAHLLTNVGKTDGMFAGALEATYRFARRWRAGLRVFFPLGGGNNYESTSPWPSTMHLFGGAAPGIIAAFSPLYRENSYDVALEGGLDLQVLDLTIVNPTLPRQFSVTQDSGTSSKPKLGFHGGIVSDFYLSTAFSLGLAARYYWVSGYTVEFNGQTMTRSMSAFSLSPRITVRF